MYPKFLSNFLIIGCLLLLSACSSDDKDKNNQLPEKTVSLTIEGYVETTSFIHAEVRLQVADTEFYGEVDALGNYSIDIDIPESQIDSFVRAEAIFPAESSIRLVSLLGSVRTLLEKSGEDGVLVRAELLDVNITSLSTALSAVIETTNDGPVISQSQYELAYHKIDASVVFAIATSLKMLINDSPYLVENGLGLPEKFIDIYELATNYNEISLYVAKVTDSVFDLFVETKKEIVREEGILASSPSKFSFIADSYYLPSKGVRLILRDDGTGEINSLVDSVDITWVQTNNAIIIDGADLVISFNYNEFDSSYEETHYKINKINWLSEGSNHDLIVIDAQEYEHSQNEEYKNSVFGDRTDLAIALRSSGMLPISDKIELGKLYSLPIVTTPSEIINPMVEITSKYTVKVLDMRFHGSYESGGIVDITFPEINESGELFEFERSGVWYLDYDDKIVVEMPNGVKLIYCFLNYEYKDLDWVFVLEDFEGKKTARFYTSFVQNLKGWEETEISGIYQLTDPKYSFWWPLDHYWVELKNDGAVMMISAYDSDLSGSLEDDEISIRHGLWKLNSKNNIEIRQYSDQSYKDCDPLSWNPPMNSDCQLHLVRNWEIFSVVDDQTLHVKSNFQFFSNTEGENVPSDSNGSRLNLESTLIYHSVVKKLSERPINIPYQ
ncbi:hypothetical protein ACJJIT_20400 [Microbulbifer sp. SSSA003]